MHLEGSLRPDTMRALAARHGTPIDEDLGKAYRFGSFDEFARLFMLGLSLLRDAEDFCRQPWRWLPSWPPRTSATPR